MGDEQSMILPAMDCFCEPVIGPATSARTLVRNDEVALTCAHRPLIAGFILRPKRQRPAQGR
jgi:hypothetical protein